MLRKAGHIGLVLLLFLSTTGMSISFHFCDHTLYDIGFFSHAESCCVPHEILLHKQKASDHCTADYKQEGHCKDETVTVKHVDDFIASASQANFIPDLISFHPFFSVHAAEMHAIPPAFHSDEIPARDNAPPGLPGKLSFLQTYLI